MYPYASYVVFSAKYFSNVLFVTLAFLFWIGITIILVRALRLRLWLKVPLIAVISGTYYLLFGLLIAGGQFGGEANFLYDPAHISDNMSIYHGWQLIALWPLSLLTTGGYLIVLPVLIFGWGFWYSRSSRHHAT